MVKENSLGNEVDIISNFKNSYQPENAKKNSRYRHFVDLHVTISVLFTQNFWPFYQLKAHIYDSFLVHSDFKPFQLQCICHTALCAAISNRAQV